MGRVIYRWKFKSAPIRCMRKRNTVLPHTGDIKRLRGGEKITQQKHEPGAHTSAMNVGILQSIAEISNSNPESDKFYESLAETLDTDEIVVLTPRR